MEQVDYERLPQTVGNFQKIKIPGLTAELVERTESEAIYYRWDNVYEVFRIRVAPECDVFGKKYPRREVYPGNEQFGSTAWCFRDRDMAYERYEAIKRHKIDPTSLMAGETDDED